MPILTVTQALGGKSRSIGMTVVAPPAELPEGELDKLGDPPTVHGPALADLLSAFMAHERATVRLCLSAARQASNDDWQSVFGGTAREHLSHLGIFEDLVTRIGAVPGYVSPAARAADYHATKLMEATLVGGSAGTGGRDLALLDSVVAAGAKCCDNRQVLGRIARHLPSGHLQQMIDACVSQLQAEGDDYARRATEMRQAALVDEVVTILPALCRIERPAGDRDPVR